jgi:Flp pilus assembly protein TadG
MLSKLYKYFSLKILKDKQGVSAVEFAFIAPIIVMAYLGLCELTLGMMASRRTSHLAAAVGDLTAQSETLTSANITDIFQIAGAMMDPFPIGPKLQVRITSITMGTDFKARVDWSDGKDYAAHAPGSVISTVTKDQLAVGDSLIMTEVIYTFDAPFESSNGKILPLTQTYDDIFYHHPRNGSKVTRIP